MASCGVVADGAIADALGLTWEQNDILCYKWLTRWPEPFRNNYAKRHTALGKAKVAVALLKEVVRTAGKCLDEN
jgi:hypothetical protein